MHAHAYRQTSSGENVQSPAAAAGEAARQRRCSMVRMAVLDVAMANLNPLVLLLTGTPLSAAAQDMLSAAL